MILYRKPVARLTSTASVVALILAVVLATASQATAADGPVWKLLATSEPTNLQAPQGEIAELTVKATAGETLIFVSGKFVVLPYDATASTMQTALEGNLGAGNVLVTGGPGGASGSSPYVIAFTGELTGREIPFLAFGEYPNEQTETANLRVTRKAADGGTVVMTAVNVGGPTDGSAVTVSDTLPVGLVAGAIEGSESYESSPLAVCKQAPPSYSCSYAGVMGTGDTLSVRVPVTIGPGAPTSVLNTGIVSGGGAESSSSASTQLAIDNKPASFGVEPGSVLMATSSPQAGAHPDVTTSFELATSGPQQPAGSVKDVRADLPPGLVGNTVGLPRCTTARALEGECPRDTIVGVANVVIKLSMPRLRRPPSLLPSSISSRAQESPPHSCSQPSSCRSDWTPAFSQTATMRYESLHQTSVRRTRCWALR